MTPVEPIGGLRYVVENHESNAGWLERDGEHGRRWVAKIHWNGEPHEAKQTATGMALAQAPAMLELLRDFRAFADRGTFTYPPGSIQRLDALIEAATHHIEEREVDER